MALKLTSHSTALFLFFFPAAVHTTKTRQARVALLLILGTIKKKKSQHPGLFTFWTFIVKVE